MHGMADMQQYLERHNVPDIITAMVESLCMERPQDVIRHMQRFLHNYPQKALSNGAFSASTSFSLGASDSSLEVDSDSESDSHQNNAHIATVDDQKFEQIRRRYSMTNRRQGVSSEVIDAADEAQSMGSSAPTGRAPNTPEVRAQIEKSLLNNILFAQLEKSALDTISESMFECSMSAGEPIIKQYDQADNFYVIESGICNVYVQSGPDEESRLVSTLGPGSCFGELALMYGTPRAATVQAATDVRLWALDRDTYRRILLKHQADKRHKFQEFLKKVPILETLNDYERMTIADALQQATYAAGAVIVQEGEPGNSFYMIEEGEVRVTQTRDGVVTELSRLKSGGFFGEVALMLNQPRVATVTAIGDVSCVKLDRKSFTRLLGPIEDLLKRNMQTYSLYISQRI